MDQPTIDLYNQHYEAGWRNLNRVILLDGRGYRPLWIWGRWNARSAISHFRKCLRIAPEMWQCEWAIGKAHQALNDNQKALECFERVLTVQPDHAGVLREAYLSAGFIGDVVRAESYAKRALDLQPDNASLANYAVALLLLGRVSEALSTAQRACSDHRSNRINAAILKMVEDVSSGKRAIPKRLPK